MTRVLGYLNTVGETSQLFGAIVRQLFRGKFYFKLLIEQIFQVGWRSLPLILTVGASVGSVMALQFGVGLEKFGGTLYVPKIVSVSILRELGPVFTSLMLAARVGAGFASEIGSLTVTQQIDAYRALGASPIKVIVIPRVLACMIALPILTVLANSIGVLGGLLIGASDLGLDPSFYWQKTVTTLAVSDFFSGFFKTIFFAVFISVPACYYGLRVRGGTRGVGLATTKAVVTGAILIVLSDFILTKAFLVIEQWK